MQGHALFVRQAGGVLPCPQVDFTGGFNGFLAAAYGLGNRSVEEVFGSPFDPFMNDQNFVMSVLTLEEFGATGNKVSALSYQQTSLGLPVMSSTGLECVALSIKVTWLVVKCVGIAPEAQQVEATISQSCCCDAGSSRHNLQPSVGRWHCWSGHQCHRLCSCGEDSPLSDAQLHCRAFQRDCAASLLQDLCPA